MFREMRRKRQAISLEESVAVLMRGTSGVLAVLGDNGYPYAVPISYAYYGTHIYFHCAKAGHKLDAIKQNHKVSFCVIDKDEVIPDEYTSYFRSVIVFGTIRIIENEREKRSAIEKLALKYVLENDANHRKACIDKEWGALCMLEMTIEHLTGKEAIELMRAKNPTEKINLEATD